VATVTVREAWEFDPDLARDDLLRTYGIASLDGLGISADDRPAVGAAGALLRYARELKPGGLPHLAHPTIVRRGDVLPLDEMTRRNLELVEPLRAGAEGATLLDVIDRTLTPMGGRLLRRWLLAPLVDPARSMRGSTRCRCSSAMAGAASGCARRSMVCATLNAWQDARRWAAPTRARWARCGTRSCGSPMSRVR